MRVVYAVYAVLGLAGLAALAWWAGLFDGAARAEKGSKAYHLALGGTADDVAGKAAATTESLRDGTFDPGDVVGDIADLDNNGRVSIFEWGLDVGTFWTVPAATSAWDAISGLWR